MRKKLEVVAFVAAVALAMIPPVAAIINGQLDGNNHPYVALINNGQFTCSSVAVDTRVVLRTAHCAVSENNVVSVTFDTQADSTHNPTWLTGVTHIAPGWCVACAPGLVRHDTHDVGVIPIQSR